MLEQPLSRALGRAVTAAIGLGRFERGLVKDQNATNLARRAWGLTPILEGMRLGAAQHDWTGVGAPQVLEQVIEWTLRLRVVLYINDEHPVVPQRLQIAGALKTHQLGSYNPLASSNRD